MVYYSRDERAERGVAIAVNISIMIIIVTNIVCNDKIIALKPKAKPVYIMLVQAHVYMSTAETEDNEVQEPHIYYIRNFEDDGKGDKHHQNGRVEECGWR
jgi:hypothetical protein